MRLAMFNQKKSRDLDISTQLSFLNRLAKLLQRNRSMRDALEFMTYDPQLGQIAKRFVSELQTGTTIPESFRRMKFQPLVVSFLFLSSETGHFSDHLIQLNRLLLMRQEFEKRLKQLLRYPLFLLLICMLLIIMLNSFLLPTYERTLYHMTDNTSITIFRFVLTATQMSIFIVIVLSVLSLILLYLFQSRATVEQKIWFYERLPVARGFIRFMITSQLAYHLFALLQSGKTIKESLVVLQSNRQLIIISYLSELITAELQRGKKLNEAFHQLPLLTEDFKLIIRRGSEQGSLTNDLNQYASLMVDAAEEKIKRSMMIIQPIIYGVLGILIVVIYAFTLFPMFQMLNHI